MVHSLEICHGILPPTASAGMGIVRAAPVQYALEIVET